MSIAVFGASGSMGRRFIAAATEAGVALRLHYRSAPEDEAPLLSTVVVGALTDPTAVREVLRGASATVVLFGPRPNSEPFCAKATRAIIEGMRSQEQTRLLCMTCASLGPPAGNLSIAMRAAAMAMKRFRNEEQLDDREAQERTVRNSKLDWTLVKPTRFTDGGGSENVRAATNLDVGLRSRVSRDSVAMFLLSEINAPKFSSQTVYVSSDSTG